MKTFLANAFALVSLQTVQEFHLYRAILMPPTVPINHYLEFRKPTK